MSGRDDELEFFKTEINLSEFAAMEGYELDPRATSRNSAVMKHPEGDKIVIAQGSDRHWVYFSVRDHQDHGSLIDFVQNRHGFNLGQVRVELRRWMPGAVTPRPKPGTFVSGLEPIHRDTGFVRLVWDAMEGLPFGEMPYLNRDRRLSADLLRLPFLEDRIRVDARGNAAFIHFNRSGVSGFELKNNDFTGFAPHGTKGLWGTRPGENDNRLVIAETAIDALSYAALHGHQGVRLISTGGSMNPQQPDLIRSAIGKLPAGQVIVATDNDAGGDGIALAIEQEFNAAGHGEVELIEHRAPARGEDWNQVLQQKVVAPAPGFEGP